MNAENRDLKHLAEKACISYLKSVHLMKEKEVFNLKNVDPEKLALSLGLATSPIISFIK
jgi:ATP-dependent RNA helicase DDX10/DBP4